MSTKRAYHCRRCGEVGHNVRTCKADAPTVEQASPVAEPTVGPEAVESEAVTVSASALDPERVAENAELLDDLDDWPEV